MPLHAAARAARTRALHQVVAQLLADGVTSSAGVEDITKARVPLIRFVDCSSGVQVDLVAGSAREDLKAWLVAQAAELQPAFSPLFRLVKLWAKANGINDAASHTFNSWCITLLVMFHLQRHVSPPMLPPLQQLLHDAPPPARAPRLLQGDQELPDELRADVVRRVGRLKSRYSGVQAAGGGGGGGGGGAVPGGASLLELFRGFVRDGGGLMRAALHNKKPLTRPLGISPFYGDIRPCRPYDLNRMLLFVEDPFNSADNVARTLHRHKRRHGTTLDYITQLFERTARLLQADTGASTSTSSSPGGEPIPPSEPAAPNAADTGRVASHASASTSTSTGGGSGNAAGAAAGKAPQQPPSLASTLVFLFGPQLVNKLPDLSRRLLGPQLHAWAEEELESGRRPVWEVHGELLRRLGADMSDFDTFADFKKRNRIKVINDDKYMTEEELTAAEDERVQWLAVKELSSRRVAAAWAALPKCVPQLLAAARAALDAVPHLTFDDLAAVQPADSRAGGMPAAAVAAAPAATPEMTTLIAGVRAAAEAHVLAAVSAAVEAEQGEVGAAAGDASDDSDGSARRSEEAAPARLGAAGPDAATGFSARAAAALLPPRTLHQLAAALQVEAAEAALRAVRELQAVRAMTAAGFSGADASAAQELADRSRVMALLTAAAAQELRARQGVLRSAQLSKLHRARGALPASTAAALADGPSQAGALEPAAAASAEAAAVDAAAAATAGSAAASKQGTARQVEPAKAGTAKQSAGGGKPAAPQRKPTSPSASKKGSPADSPAAVAAAIAAAAASAAGKGAQPPKQPARTQPGPLVTQPVRRSAKPRGARPAVQVKAGASGRASSTKARATAAVAAGQAAAKASQPRPKTPRRRGASAKPAASAEEK